MIVLKMTYIYWYHSQYDVESNLFFTPTVLYKRKSEKIHGRIISVVGC